VVLLFNRVTQWKGSIDAVLVTAAVFGRLEVAGFDQIGHDALGRPFGDPDLLRNIAETDLGIGCDAVPVQGQALRGIDSLLSLVQMPAGVPVGTLAVGETGAINAAFLAIAILANSRPALRERLRPFREDQNEQVRSAPL
jgi:hypothetical protein